jgi:hypothetical protein
LDSRALSDVNDGANQFAYVTAFVENRVSDRAEMLHPLVRQYDSEFDRPVSSRAQRLVGNPGVTLAVVGMDQFKQLTTIQWSL